MKSTNKILFDDRFITSLHEIIERYIHIYQNEFALRKFLKNLRQAIHELEFVGEFEGSPSDPNLLALGLRRKRIKQSKYLILYTYHPKTILLFDLQYSKRNFKNILNW
ncbi:type II toxin-antitoxin system RelE/ParE family toxin [Candidatus Saccharibacteria bacterium]|nr:type II toxin-antitoxin system RelE/ParE family toxin [Candidatus Saccharibacteria bacterium]